MQLENEHIWEKAYAFLSLVVLDCIFFKHSNRISVASGILLTINSRETGYIGKGGWKREETLHDATLLFSAQYN